MNSEVMVTTPPDVVRIRASSTVLVNASSLVNLDLGGMTAATAPETEYQAVQPSGYGIQIYSES